MTDNIFQAKRDRMLLLSGLPGSSPSNLRVPVPKSGALGRYEDAEASRLRILAAQQKKPKRPARKLKKRQAERQQRRIGESGGRVGKGRRGESQVVRDKPKAEEDLEFMRDKLRNERAETQRKARESYIQVQRDYRRDTQRDRELDIQDRTAQAVLQAAQLQVGVKDVVSQREVQQRIADRQANAALEDRRQRLQRDRIRAEQLQGGRQRGLEHRRLNEETRRFDADVNDRRQQRAADINRHQQDLQQVRDRVAAQDALRAQEIQQQHELALGELAERGRQREQLQENERFKLDHQRQIDSDRAVSDRQREESLQQALELLRHNKPPDELSEEHLRAREHVRQRRAGTPPKGGGGLGPTEEEFRRRGGSVPAGGSERDEPIQRGAGGGGGFLQESSDDSDLGASPPTRPRQTAQPAPEPSSPPQQVPALPAPSSTRDTEPPAQPIPRVEEETQTENPLHGAQPASPRRRRHQTADERLQDLLGQPATATPPHREENPIVGRPITPEREG